MLTGSQLQPSSPVTSLLVLPRSAWRVTQRLVGAVGRCRGGVIAGFCWVAVGAEHSGFERCQRRLCHTSRAGCPNTGRSSNSACGTPTISACHDRRSLVSMPAEVDAFVTVRRFRRCCRAFRCRAVPSTAECQRRRRVRLMGRAFRCRAVPSTVHKHVSGQFRHRSFGVCGAVSAGSGGPLVELRWLRS